MTLLPMTAVEWRVGDFDPHGPPELRIVERWQLDGRRLFAVMKGGWVANSRREWEREPIPSSRGKAFLARCRFADWETAAELAQHMARRDELWAERGTAGS